MSLLDKPGKEFFEGYEAAIAAIVDNIGPFDFDEACPYPRGSAEQQLWLWGWSEALDDQYPCGECR